MSFTKGLSHGPDTRPGADVEHRLRVFNRGEVESVVMQQQRHVMTGKVRKRGMGIVWDEGHQLKVEGIILFVIVWAPSKRQFGQQAAGGLKDKPIFGILVVLKGPPMDFAVIEDGGA